ncbi:surface-adhesin E family protein [Acidovorax sp. Root219]|uniref:surface-adhesin E family protein n=1 Tax=Acidovorax sp. Root219 TaxID=1736493 RepID=UPI00070CEBE6|nr:surface-adhesin E family protein [Acidovorax sp. Root219]KRC25525.1 hypothetical protein ASE28_24070 [Acidovorax sp. Root219]
MLCAVVLCIAALVGGQQPPAQPQQRPVSSDGWFTLSGDRAEAGKNLIEILPEPIGVDQRVVLDLRVSRDQQRTSFRGQKYRSYYAKVVVDCPSRKAWYLWLSYYAQPEWAGAIVGREEYKEGEAPVLFKDMSGEWSRRMISAACKVRNL